MQTKSSQGFQNKETETAEMIKECTEMVVQAYGLAKFYKDEWLRNDNSSSDLNSIALKCLSIGASFIDHPTKTAFNRIIKKIEEENLWEFIPIIFGSSPYVECKTNWLLEAYMKLKNRMPKEILWNVLMDVYIFNGFEFPKKLIYDALPYRPKDYLSTLPLIHNDEEYVTVYRASNKNPLLYHPRYDLAWSINPRVAKKFYTWRIGVGQPCYIYKAKLKKSDILMCVDTKNENDEVLQYDSITNLIQLTEAALDREIKLFDHCVLWKTTA